MTPTKLKLSRHQPSMGLVVGLDVHKHQLATAIYGKDRSNSEFVKSNIFSTDHRGLADFWNFVVKYRPVGFRMVLPIHKDFSLYFN